MDFSGAERLNQAINSPADLSRDELIAVLKECSNIQNTYSQQSAVNKLINSCINYKKFTTLSQLLKLIGTRATFSFLNIQMLNLNDAFNFLLQTSNVLDCFEIVKLFQENNVELPDKSVDMVISTLISTDKFKEARELLFLQIKIEKAGSINFRDHVKFLLLRGEVNSAFSILEKYPMPLIDSLYIWEDMIRSTCTSDKSHEFLEFFSKHVKTVAPNNTKEFEEISSLFIKALIENNCPKEIVISALRDVAGNSFSLKTTAIKPALSFLITKNVDIELFIKILKDFSYMLTSEVYSHIITRLLQAKRFAEALTLLDLVMYNQVFKFSYSDLNLTINDFKLIIYLQNYAISSPRKEKYGDAKVGESEFEVLLPDKSINNPIDKITFDELRIPSMPIIGNKNLYRSDLFDILFNNVQIAVDNAIKNEFSKPKSDRLQITDFKGLVTDLNKKISEEALVPKSREFNNLFSRAYLFFILLAVLRQRGKVRLELAEFIADLLNKRAQYTFFNEPYTVLLIFYGEGGAGSLIASLGQLPALTEDEKNFILSVVEVSYFLALSSQNLHYLQNLLVLADTSYALSLEKNAVKQDFLLVKYETRSFNKFVNSTASAVTNLTSGSKFSKAVPTQAISSWVDIAAQVKNVVYDYLGSIAEECTAEENENLKDLKIASISVGIKDWEVYNILTTTLLNSLIPLIANTVNRLLDSKELNKSVAEKVSEYQKIASKLTGSLQLFNFSKEKSDAPLGFNFTNLFKVDEFIQVLYDLTSIEGLDALKYLVSLNDTIAAKSKGGKPEEEKKDDKGPKKVVSKITPGKGTAVVFQDFAANLAGKIETIDIDDQLKKFKETYFNPSDQKQVSFLSDLTSSKNDERRKPQVPKGTRDMTPLQMAIRNRAMTIIKGVFLRHGAVEIDTPVFELKETLTGKYGEDSKLIYDLQDQGGQLLALRYDLTVPFARYLAMKNIQNIKRFHIAKVYRRDQPAMNKGRYREFYQCDYDIAGAYGLMVPDAEALNVLNEILSLLDVGKYEVKLNNRKLLDAIIELSGSPKDKFKQICSSIDKLDKEPWTEVRRELIQERGLTDKMADKIGEFVKLRGPPFELVKKLVADGVFKGSKVGEECLAEMEILFKYLGNLNCLDSFVFDLSLARGLDYYTGIIFEAVLLGANVGSIAGGGRYDNLVGMFSNKDIPAVGVSIGIERLFAILEEKYKDDPKIRCSHVEVLVASIGSGMVGHRLSLCSALWKEEINTETLYNENPKPQKQLSHALENAIPFMIFIGEDEVKNNKVKLKTLYKNEEITVENDKLIPTLKERISQYYKDLEEGKVVFQKEKEESKDNA